MNEALGLEVNGIITKRDEKSPLALLPGEDYFKTLPADENVFHILRRMVDERFGDNVYIICLTDRRGREKTLAWLNHYGGFATTGIMPEHIIFCESWEEKRALCQKFGITHFIDSSLAATDELKDVVPEIMILNYSDQEYDRGSLRLARSKVSWNWQDVESKLLLPGLPMGRQIQPYGFDDWMRTRGSGDNALRTKRLSQPAALQPGDRLATGEEVLSPPRQGYNGSIVIHLSGRVGGVWLNVPSRLALALLTEEDGAPPELLDG